MDEARRPLAVVTGASSGIGLELARECARHGFDLVIAADRQVHDALQDLRPEGASIDSVEVDLATSQGVRALIEKIGQRPVAALVANAGEGQGGAFLDQSLEKVTHIIDTNITGTLALIHEVGRAMVNARAGRILIVGSIAGFMPGAFQAVYNASKAFIDSFSWALRNELKDTGVTVTCLMPGATETEFFKRAELMDTKAGTSHKMDAGKVARIGFEAMMNGEGDVVAGLKNKLQSAIAAVTPAGVLAEQHRKQFEPGTANK
jgi:short-subunit dehydrogenase